MTQDRQTPPERELGHAGSVVDKAIEFMVGQEISPLAIASALLGGAIGLLAQSLPDEMVVQILQNAMTSVQSGEMRATSGNGEASELL